MSECNLLVSKHHDLQERLCIKNLKYTYFYITNGDGACFFNALSETFSLSQYKCFLDANLQNIVSDPLLLRRNIVDFIRFYNTNDELFRQKKQNQIIVLKCNNPNLHDDVLWEQYLSKCEEPYEWANDLIIEMTAWFLNVNIRIIGLDYDEVNVDYVINSKNESPYCIPLGCFSQVHFQSLVDIEIYAHHKQCLGCRRVFQNIKLHLAKAHNCAFCYKPNFFLKYLDNLCNEYKKPVESRKRKSNPKKIGKTTLKSSKIVANNDLSNLNIPADALAQKKKLAALRAKTYYERNREKILLKRKLLQKTVDSTVRASRNKRYYEKSKDTIKSKRRTKYVSVKEKTNYNQYRKRSSILLNDPIINEFLYEAQSERKHFNFVSQCPKAEMPILHSCKAFFLETLWGARFPCFVCHRGMFANGVKKLNLGKLETFSDLDKSILLNFKTSPQFFVNCSLWICHNCDNKIKLNKMPPQSAANRLECPNIPDFLNLSDIENALICPMLVFLKLIRLPSSGMFALKDRVVNVPISSTTIKSTVESLPRSLDEANIIPVAIRRKKNYVSNYIKQFVCPSKLTQAVNYLIQYYPFYNTIHFNFNKLNELFVNSFADCCEENVTAIHNDMLLNVVDEILDDSNQQNQNQSSSSESVLLLPENLEDYINQKTTLQDNNKQDSAFVFAPGEGETPSNVLDIDHPFVRQFPGLFPKGEFGLHDSLRKIKLSPIKYLNQRMLNINKVFVKNKTFLFSAVFYLEIYMLMYRIRISFLHGKFMYGDGKRAYLKINDAFQIFDAIPGSLRYLRTFRYELLARLEQLGIPILFYTLSMANSRWAVNIATAVAKKYPELLIMHKLEEIGINLRQFMADLSNLNKKLDDPYNDEDELEELSDSFNFVNADFDLFTESAYIVHHVSINCQYIDVCLECTLHEDCHRISLTDFINNLPPPISRATLHAESVLDEVRIYNHRLKSFRKHILTSTKLPFHILFYADRIEFQARGYPHTHGLGWGDLDKIDSEFPGFKMAMSKVTSGTDFDILDKKILISFADACISCSSDVSDIMSFGLDFKIAKTIQLRINQFNVHRHSKSCKKFNNKCRFFFPRFPADVTLIAEPISKTLKDHPDVAAFVKTFLTLIKRELNNLNIETTSFRDIHDIINVVIDNCDINKNGTYIFVRF